MRCHFPHFGDIQLWVWVEMVDLIRLVPAVHPPLSQVTLAQPSGSIWSGQRSQQVLILPATCPSPNLVPPPCWNEARRSAHPLSQKEGSLHLLLSRLTPPHPRLLVSAQAPGPEPPRCSSAPSVHFWLSLEESLFPDAPSHLSDHPNLTALQGHA